MNKNLDRCQPYPFERLSELLANSVPDPSKRAIRWSIGEPAHPAPDFVKRALADNLSGLSNYPVTIGSEALREAIAGWLISRFGLADGAVDPASQVLPVSGTREALFSFAQAVVNGGNQALVAMPNPFYQIYEGAALLSGAEPFLLDLESESGFLPDFQTVEKDVWKRVQLIYVSSPSNPAGSCFTIEKWRELLDLSNRFGFIIASDECYSEIYLDEEQVPLGLLAAAYQSGNHDFKNCVVFHSLSKRSNLPGLRSGFVAGDREVISKYRLYRTYHGCALPPPTQAASLVAWQDETHVRDNRKLYRRKFDAVLDILDEVLDVERPQASFYLWPSVGGDDALFAKHLFEEENLLVLPGSYISRNNRGNDPGKGRLRMALVAPYEECVEGARRLAAFVDRRR